MTAPTSTLPLRTEPAGRLRGQVALVTGAGSLGSGWGNGKAAAALFAAEGATVFAVDRRLDAARETAELIRAAGGECTPWHADVSHADEVEVMTRACVDAHGAVDVLLNNVGIGVVGGIEETSPKHWDLTQRVNLTSAFLTSRAIAPLMAAAGGGAIVNVSSVASLGGTGDALAAYGVSKAGLNALTREIAVRYAPAGVRCNAVVPGLIDTPTVYAGQPDVAPETLRARRAARCPTGRMGEPWDVAYAALYLAGRESAYVTGALLVVDGGLSLRFGSAES